MKLNYVLNLAFLAATAPLPLRGLLCKSLRAKRRCEGNVDRVDIGKAVDGPREGSVGVASRREFKERRLAAWVV